MGVNESPNSRVLLIREGTEAKEGVQTVTHVVGNAANLSGSRVSKFCTSFPKHLITRGPCSIKHFIAPDRASYDKNKPQIQKERVYN